MLKSLSIHLTSQQNITDVQQNEVSLTRMPEVKL